MYPDNPDDLPVDLFDYDKDDGPSKTETPTTFGDDDLAALRKNSKRLKGSLDQSSLVPYAPQQARTTGLSQMEGMLCNTLMNFCGSFMQRGSEEELAGLQFMKPKGKGGSPHQSTPSSNTQSPPARVPAIQDTQSPSAPSTVRELTYDGAVPKDQKEANALQLPCAEEALNETKPPSPEEQAATVRAALLARTEEREAAKPKGKPEAKGKPKAKGKAKAKAQPKSAPGPQTTKPLEAGILKVKAVPKPKPKATTKSAKAVRPVKDFKVRGKLLTAKFRLAKFPHGCGKCRNRPGCTPSCWTFRHF